MLKLMIITLIFPTIVGSRLLLRPYGLEFPSPSGNKNGCSFGIRNYKIGTTWNPEVSPFGVLNCVLCSCIKHAKKPGNYGKVSCRSTRNRCPKTSCTNPEFQRNQCCPTCPPEFVALLAPSQSSSSKSFSREIGLARVHLTLIKRSLHISIYYQGNQRPKTLLFYKQADKKLGELNIQRKFINGTKICLLWSDLNDQQTKQLTTKTIDVVLKFKRRSESLRGQLVSYDGYSEDAFESVLQAKLDGDLHMAALASLRLSRNRKYLHVTLYHNRFTHTGGKQIVASAHFIKAPQSGNVQVLHSIPVTSLQTDGEIKKITWSGSNEQNLKWLVRGILNMTLKIKAGGQTVEMTGRITIKKTCNVIYALMAGRDATKPTVTGSSGYVSFHFQDNGHLQYKLSISGLMQHVIEITLEMSRKRLVKKLSRSISSDEHSRVQIEDTWERPSAAEISLLFSGGISVNVRTALYRNGELRGHVKQLPYGGHHASFEDSPFLLSGNEVIPSTRTGASGLAWLSLDRHCSLHYNVLLKGLNRGQSNVITADLEGFAFFGEQPLEYKKERLTLRSFTGTMISGVVRDLDDEFLSNMFRGRVYLQISSNDSPRGELRGQVQFNDGPCRPPITGMTGQVCISEGQTYFNGEAWTPEYDQKCTTCSCKDSKVICFPIVCTPQNCSEALVVLPDKCCPVCPVMESQLIRTYAGVNPPKIKGCFVDQGSKFYPSGSVWHPYVEPFGYMKCVVCTCLASSNEISCSKVQCAQPKCKNPVKKHQADCCARCPDSVISSKSAAQSKVCQFGQITYPEGARWSPYMPPFGLIKCVTCQCQNSKVSCITVKCPDNYCKSTFSGMASKSCCVPCNGRTR
ncbi:chordin-like [Actinia tenebrosa]|uniref:Chordin-like n=1 Tax=Actinia tenebrosa TaxID=6105 RepID=A0A6P8IMT7_ACTTE|nr:chordin-like [Actinia tenebrosa]